MLHQPVMLTEVLNILSWSSPEISIADFTVGGGGHLRALLENNPRPQRIVAMDQDRDTLEKAKENLKSWEPIEWHHMNFREAASIAKDGFDRILIDLGVSSFQLDSPERGFSFQKNGPLDMRMDSTQGMPAWKWLMRCSKMEFEQVLKKYSEEPRARWFAKRWNERKNSPIQTTEEFVRFFGFKLNSKDHHSHGLNSHGLNSHGLKGRHPMTRVFQAIRIHINDEMGALQNLLALLPKILKPQGRVVILTFHSLEDREVKWSLRGRLNSHGLDSHGLNSHGLNSHGLKALNKKVRRPSLEEIRLNHRCRSAKLRAFEKAVTD